MTFLVLADGTLDARSLPQVLLLGCGQIVGLVAAGLAVNGLRRAATAQPWEVAHSVATQLSRALIVLTGIAPIIAIGCLVLVRPLTLTALSVLLSMAILAQLAIVLITVRGKLRRAAQSRRTR